MRTILSLGAMAGLLSSTVIASATVRVAIDLTHQRMHVTSNEGGYDWPISSARSGFYTPGGSFAPTHLELMHYSKKYHMSPMPHAIFFRGGYAIHGTYSTGSLGRPASHGCVRLSPGNAATLYNMVLREGARISISGSPPASSPFAIARSHRLHRDAYAEAPMADAASQGYGYADAQAARPRRHRRAYIDGSARQPQYYGYSQSYNQAPTYAAPGAYDSSLFQSPLTAGAYNQ